MCRLAKEGTMADAERLLIVGAGIAGLTLTAALHQHGLNPELVEQSAEWIWKCDRAPLL